MSSASFRIQGWDPARVEPPSVLLISDEWSPTRGGISRFNRRLAITFAAEGYRTACLVKGVSEFERSDAQQHGIRLFAAPATPDGPSLFVPSPEVIKWRPDVVIGHDIVSGSVAWTYTEYYVPSAALVHVMHTAPAQNESFKPHPDRAQRIAAHERRMREIAADAAVVAAVGPLLRNRAEAILDSGDVLQLDPGIDIPDDPRWLRRSPPSNSIVLMVCRTEHIEPKGLDIAAGAVAGMRFPHHHSPPELRIRGAHRERCDSLKDNLVARFGIGRDRIDVREYDPNPAAVAHDLGHAALFLMPSRAEGFGLAALEAIGLGTPVLISGRSGLAQMLRDNCPEVAEPMIVPVVDDLEEDIRVWRSAVERKMDNLNGAFGYAREMQRRLAVRFRWSTTVSTLVSRLPVPASRRSKS
ncbi:glycosyltransferase family 4 protein [Amycolatopsis japonica]|uniref:glycosyltransferase family 4 protein n=1 Tax=Amycolatopsis japonica TaxID=208439 RepID=UPI0037BD41E9